MRLAEGPFSILPFFYYYYFFLLPCTILESHFRLFVPEIRSRLFCLFLFERNSAVSIKIKKHFCLIIGKEFAVNWINNKNRS